MRGLFSLVVILFLSIGQLMSQSGSIRGVVVNKANSEPVEFVNVVINVPEDGSFVAGSVTDIDGAFIVTDLPIGSYNLSVSYVGYKPNTISFGVKA